MPDRDWSVDEIADFEARTRRSEFPMFRSDVPPATGVLTLETVKRGIERMIAGVGGVCPVAVPPDLIHMHRRWMEMDALLYDYVRMSFGTLRGDPASDKDAGDAPTRG